jgi:hypothetical protein
VIDCQWTKCFLVGRNRGKRNEFLRNLVEVQPVNILDLLAVFPSCGNDAFVLVRSLFYLVAIVVGNGLLERIFYVVG